jgi:hypothetical protein
MTMECRGGILADEMGMGKSLTLLALIMHTLDEARSFKHSPKNPTIERETKRRSSATLLITPKSSKLVSSSSKGSSAHGILLALYGWETQIKQYDSSSQFLTLD